MSRDHHLHIDDAATLPIGSVSTSRVRSPISPSDTATFTAAGAGQDAVTIDGGLESMTFANPTGQLIVNGDAVKADTFTFTSLDSGFRASLDVLGGIGNDTTNFNIPNFVVGSATASRSEISACCLPCRGRLPAVRLRFRVPRRMAGDDDG